MTSKRFLVDAVIALLVVTIIAVATWRELTPKPVVSAPTDPFVLLDSMPVSEDEAIQNLVDETIARNRAAAQAIP